MAENSRSQNRHGQSSRGNNSPDSRSIEEQVSNRGKTSRSLRNTNLDRMRDANRTPKSSGLSEKRNITGTDYDGQLSDE